MLIVYTCNLVIMEAIDGLSSDMEEDKEVCRIRVKSGNVGHQVNSDSDLVSFIF